MKKIFVLIVLFCFSNILCAQSQKISYVQKFANENHEQIGYWFITPALIADTKKALANIDSIASKCNYTMLFLTAREGADFYDLKLLHPFFKQLVAEGHRKGIKVGLQLWGNYKDKTMEGSQRMIVENEVTLDERGSASFTAKARYIRFADRLLKSDLFKVYAFKKTGEGFYDPATLKDISSSCEVVLPDKATVQVSIKAGAALKGQTACIMTQQYCSQSSMWDDVEIKGFTEAMTTFADIPFDGFALDEYGNKFIERIFDQRTAQPFRGRWYSTAMAKAYAAETRKDLAKTLFDGRYAPEGKPEVRIAAINAYMEFMRKGALRVETAVFHKSREIFGKNIFSGIHNTYHNSLINDEIWANGIGWWTAPRAYGQTDEKTFLPTQMGVAMSHPMNAMYNQYYDAELSPVVVKAIHDLRYGIRTHYHALNDKRPLRFDLEFPEAIDSINKIENCARLLNKFNPSLPEVKLLVIFGMEALSNWYPNDAERGVYDINDQLGIENKALEIWKAGYLNALVPSDLIVNQTLTIGKDGKPVMNGHKFDAVLFLNPQYAREPVLKFLEAYQKQGGKLMIEGKADRDFKGKLIAARFKSIYDKATVRGYQIEGLSRLGLKKNFLPDGCKNEDGSYVFTDLNSLRTGRTASFALRINGDKYTGEYKGLAVLAADKKTGVKKFAAAGCKSLSRNGQLVLSFSKPVDFYMEKKNGILQMTIADGKRSATPLINKL
ncbi:hypothetical protein HDC92_004862 [Pedobacter sp. AK017]|uniref:hypothetical protein n=1 Tax=Pedobacter sp. AK017 TaxID=2723073 RepID=UPI00160D8FC4|nr:hypothetical protein [Pedobacter sp. AK017]MBB5441157.1 hypothetical protein [Pedobacter sp. AK017]